MNLIINGFYSNLYRANSFLESEALADSFFKNVAVLKLSDVRKGNCEENLTVSECFNTLKSFQKNKTPRNDGLTLEFHLAFWSILGKHLVTSFNYAPNYGELSNSQKQIVITLVEKKGKDKRLIKN